MTRFGLRVLAFVIVIASVQVAASGATVRLQRSATVAGDVVALGDIAEISNTSGEKDAEIGKVPVGRFEEGAETVQIGADQVRRQLFAAGYNIGAVLIRGAAVVDVRKEQAAKPAPAATTAEVCAEQPKTPKTEAAKPSAGTFTKDAAVREKVVDAITAYVASKTKLGRDAFVVDMRDDAMMPTAAAEGNLVALGPDDIHLGAQNTFRFRIERGDGQSSIFTTRAGVSALEARVIALESIPEGAVVAESQVSLVIRHQAGTEGAGVSSVADVAGLKAAHDLKKGQVIGRQDVERPLLVRRGETVRAVFAGQGFVLTRDLLCQVDGAESDRVRLTDPNDKKAAYMGTVTGRMQVTIKGN